MLTVITAFTFRNVDVLHSNKTTLTDATPPVAIAEKNDSIEEIMLNPRLSRVSNNPEIADNTFLLTFDLFNEWDEPFKIIFDIYDGILG
jgi:hypothetical protein